MKMLQRKNVGIILWWAEGTKARRDRRWANAMMYHVDFTNTDPEMIKLFLDFLRNDVGIVESRLKLQLQIHEGDIQPELEKFWSNISKIPLSRFYKTIIRPPGNKVGKTRGTCKIRYCSKETYIKLSQMLRDTLKPLGYSADR